MEKLIILKAGVSVEDIPLEEEEITIGRDSSSDVCLEDSSVSRNHGRLFRIAGDYFIEDFGSTNGTLLNKQMVVKHILKDGDQITIGSFNLRYEKPTEQPDEAFDPDKTVVLQPSAIAAAAVEKSAPASAVAPKVATLRFFSGPHKGHIEKIERSLYTIGKPGGEVAAIARRSQGFFLLHIGGMHPMINSKEMDSSRGVQLHEGDTLTIGDTQAEISFQ